MFQRRVNASEDFFRVWDDYVAGFGDLCVNFWLGLDNIHALTSVGPTEFLVNMETFEDESAYAHYTSFAVGNAASGYKLSISGYSGTAGDSMMFGHNQMMFSTKDKDQDTAPPPINCAESCKGGWWYYFCHASNPNGLYLDGANTAHGEGINWASYKGQKYSMKTIELKVRRE